LASFAKKASTLEVVLSISSVLLDLRWRDIPVVSADLEALVVHVEDQVLALFV
jgi:hypothetical protein